MRLDVLCQGMPATVLRGGETDIRGLTLDSRRAAPGVLFAAAVDPIRNGEAFAADAAARGASILAATDLVPAAPAAVVALNVRDVFGRMAQSLAGNPTRDMTRIGVTGTNGKTTYTYLMESILDRAARRPGVVGTVSYRYAGITEAAPNTTPEAPELAALFARMRDAGVDAIVMEASSHGLALSRVAGLEFHLAAFTNLSRDHMDFHRDEADYLAAKVRLFSDDLADGGVCVINADDPAGREIARRARGRVRLYGAAADAHYRIASYACDAAGVRFDLVTPAGELHVTSALAGHYQVHNVAAAVASAMELGIAADVALDAIAALPAVPGRMERIADDGVAVFVDYAHTPDALENVVEACRRFTAGRLITVFGCGGDRDPGKRPLMARAAAAASDIVVVTSDNPRTEDPHAIIEQILAGLADASNDRIEADGLAAYDGGHGLHVDADRRRAIETAVLGARRGDTVLIAGKGHEDYQIIGREKIHLDDREEAAAALKKRAAADRRTA